MSQQTEVVRYLQRDPLRYILHLKMIAFHGHLIEMVHLVEEDAAGVLLLFPTGALAYDAQTYAGFDLVAMPVADSPEVFVRLLEFVPETAVIFKLIHPADAALVKERFGGTQQRAFQNFTASHNAQLLPDPEVAISTRLNDGLVAAFGENGYRPAELERYFANGGRAFSINADGKLVSVGMIFRNYAHIWEIAGLYTTPAARRNGRSAQIVQTALASIQQHGYTSRYVVDTNNAPSIRLARKVGLERFMTVVHHAVGK